MNDFDIYFKKKVFASLNTQFILVLFFKRFIDFVYSSEALDLTALRIIIFVLLKCIQKNIRHTNEIIFC